MNRMAISNLIDSMDRMTPAKGEESAPSARLRERHSGAARRRAAKQLGATLLVWAVTALVLGYALAVAP